MSDVTQILSQIESGDSSAADKLLPLVYDELRKLAGAKMVMEKPGQTLQATALVHDAYIRLVDVEKAQHWNSRGHFFAAAAEAMRRILVERARQKKSLKQGGQWQKLDLQLDGICDTSEREDLLAIDAALNKLSVQNPAAAKLVVMRYFSGLSAEESAAALGVSTRTAQRYWIYAKAWLIEELRTSGIG